MGEDLTGQTLLEKYRVEGPLGQGGMGEVYRAVHVRTGRKVAIKLLDDRFLSNSGVVQRFGREARAASAIAHPGIVEVLDLDTTKSGVPFLVMELLSGETLAARIETKGRLSQEEALTIMVQLLEALDAAHDHGVVHRDLKPENVFLVPRSRGESVKILDFGISQKEDERIAQLTVAGSVLGTPHYMAPEQALGDEQIDGRADIYAAGVVLYEGLVGDVPYDASNYNKLIHVILNEPITPPSQRGVSIDPRVEATLLKALAKDKDDRPPSAGAMAAELREVLEAGGEALSAVPSALPGAHREAAGRGNSTLPKADRPAPAATSMGELKIDMARRPHERMRSKRPSLATSAGGSVGGSPLSFEAEFGGSGGGALALELDERALVSTRPSRPARMTDPARPIADASAGKSIPVTRQPSSPGSIPARRMRSSSGATARPASLDPGGASGSYPRPGASLSPIEEAPKSTRKWPYYLGGGMIVIALAIIALKLLVPPPQPERTIGPVVDPTATQVDDNVRIDLTGLPPDARIKLDGLPVGSLPIRLRRGGEHTLEISAPGYVTREVDVQADRNRRISGRLQPAVGTVRH